MRPSAAIIIGSSGSSGPKTTSFGNKLHNGTAPGQNGRAWVSKFTSPVTGTITAIVIWLATAASGAKAKGIVYSDVSGVPTNKLGNSSGFALSAPTGFKTSPATSIATTSGDVTWIGIAGGGSGYPALGNQSPSDAAIYTDHKDGFSYASPPSTFGTPDSNDGGQSITVYAVVTYTSGMAAMIAMNSERVARASDGNMLMAMLAKTDRRFIRKRSGIVVPDRQITVATNLKDYVTGISSTNNDSSARARIAFSGLYDNASKESQDVR